MAKRTHNTVFGIKARLGRRPIIALRLCGNVSGWVDGAAV